MSTHGPKPHEKMPEHHSTDKQSKTKEEKKKLTKEQLDKVPEAYRDMAKQRMKDQGLEVGD